MESTSETTHHSSTHPDPAEHQTSSRLVVMSNATLTRDASDLHDSRGVGVSALRDQGRAQGPHESRVGPGHQVAHWVRRSDAEGTPCNGYHVRRLLRSGSTEC